MRQKVLVTPEVFDETLEYLKGHFDVTSNQANVKYSADELVDKLGGMDGAIIGSTDRITDDILVRAPSVRALCTASVGFNHIDVDACTRHGVMAANTPGVLTESVADLAIGLTLATLRRIPEAEGMLRRGEWKGTHLKEMLGRDLNHATVGIVGFGRIGQTIARRLLGFDCEVLYTSRNRNDAKSEAALKAKFVSKDELLKRSDVVILILPFTSETQHYIGRAEIELMKPTAVLVNMARGGIVDDAALAEAVRTKRLWAAGLDVYENEPKVNPGLFGLTNAVLTPHIASATEKTRVGMTLVAARNCVAALTGEPTNLLNPEVLTKKKAISA